MKTMQSMILRKTLILSLTAAILLLAPGSAFAGDSMAVPSLKPLSEETAEISKYLLEIPGLRLGFIEGFQEEGGVIISDATRQLAPDAIFYRGFGGTSIFLSEFKIGTFVGFTLNDNAKIDVMWIAE